MSNPSGGQRAISQHQRQWLVDQLQYWESQNLVSSEQGRAILERYESGESIEERRRQKLFLALCGIAAVMCAVGVILLVGYNWAALSREVKTAILFIATAGLFGASAWAYSKDRPILGQTLALLATLKYGTSIFLLAQVYHIGAHYPGGVLWWAIGAIIVGLASGSPLVGALIPVLTAVWTGMEQLDFNDPNYLYLLLSAAAFVQAYRSRKWIVVGLNIVSLALWTLFLSFSAWHLRDAGPGIVLSVFAGQWGVGQLHADRTSKIARCWTALGMLGVLGFIFPFTFVGSHLNWHGTLNHAGPWVVIGLSLLLAVAGCLRATLSQTWPMLLLVGVTLGRLLPIWPERLPTEYFALAFNALAVLLAIRLIILGSRRDSGRTFFTGVIYALVWVIVRWVSLIGDMLSSALLFFLAAAALFFTAWYWYRTHKKLSRDVEVKHA